MFLVQAFTLATHLILASLFQFGHGQGHFTLLMRRSWRTETSLKPDFGNRFSSRSWKSHYTKYYVWERKWVGLGIYKHSCHFQKYSDFLQQIWRSIRQKPIMSRSTVRMWKPKQFVSYSIVSVLCVYTSKTGGTKKECGEKSNKNIPVIRHTMERLK